jgi:hypothetical protein
MIGGIIIYYFVSGKSFNNKLLYPKIPKNKANREDYITPRICVSKSLIGCLESTDIYTKNKRIYVHTCNSDFVIQPTNKQVEDAYLFGEEWILEPVKMELFTTLYVQKEIINEQYSIWKFKNKNDIISFSITGFDYSRFYKSA